MRFLISTIILFIIPFISISQTDSLKTKVYKNSIKYDVFNVYRGMNTFTYERSITPHSSLGLLYRFILPSWEIENPSTYSMHWNLRYQFYFSKKIRSKGLYVFAQTGFRFAKNYSKLTIEYASTQSKEVYAYNYKNITMGGGLGYQWIIKKRVILGFELMYIQYLTGKKQYVSYINNSVNKDPWEKTTSQNSSYLLFFLNLGYTF